MEYMNIQLLNNIKNMETYLKLMQNPIEMKDLFFTYLKSRVRHCSMSLLDACERNCEIKSTPDGLVWEDGHFGLNTYRAMCNALHWDDKDWDFLITLSTFEICLNQVVKEINRVNGPHDHFLAFFEELQLRMFDKANKIINE